METDLSYRHSPLLSLLSRMMLTGTCFRSKAWSASIDDNGQITWCPQKIGPDELREYLPYFFTHSQKNTMMADEDGNTARAHGNMYEDDPSPEDYDGGDWDGDWDSGFPESPPPRHGRGNAYASDYEQSDRYEHSPEPLPRSRRQRNPYTNDFGHGDSYQHIPEPLPRSGRPRNPFTNNFDPRGRYQSTPEPTPRRDSRRSSYTNGFGHGGRYQHIPEPLPRSGRPRNPFTNNFDPRGRYQSTPEPTPRRSSRRSSYANDYDRDYQYEDFSPRDGKNNRRRHTFATEREILDRFGPAYNILPDSPYPRDRGYATRHENLAELLRITERGWASLQRSATYQDSIREHTEVRPRLGKFWRVVRSFFGHTA